MNDLHMISTLIAALFGAVIGSFLNVVIFRLPRKITFWRGRSCCPHCFQWIFQHLVKVQTLHL